MDCSRKKKHENIVKKTLTITKFTLQFNIGWVVTTLAKKQGSHPPCVESRQKAGCSIVGKKAGCFILLKKQLSPIKITHSPVNLNDENGPLSKLRKSYSLTLSELIPAAKMSPSGSKAATGRPWRCISPWQLLDLRSHSRMVLSMEPERKESSVGDMHSVTTRLLWPRK